MSQLSGLSDASDFTELAERGNYNGRTTYVNTDAIIINCLLKRVYDVTLRGNYFAIPNTHVPLRTNLQHLKNGRSPAQVDH